VTSKLKIISTNFAPLAAIGIGVALITYFLATKMYDRSSWKRNFEEVTVFGKSCEGAIGVQDDNWTPERELKKSHNFTPQGLPFREYPDTSPRPLAPGEFWINRCKLEVGALEKDGFSKLALGNVKGRITVFVGNRKAFEQGTFSPIEFSLFPEEKVSGLVLTMIGVNARLTPSSVGPGSLVPIYYTDSRRAAAKVATLARGLAQDNLSFISIVVFLVLLSVFSGVWILGFRYPDIVWMIVTLSAFSTYDILQYFQLVPDQTSILSKLGTCLLLLAYYGFPCFVHAYLRVEFAKNKIVWIVTGIITVHFILIAFFPGELISNLKLLQLFLNVPPLFGSFAIAFLAWRDFPRFNRGRKVKFFISLGALVLVNTSTLLDPLARKSIPSFFSINAFLILILIAACAMIAEITVFQRQYLAERRVKAAVQVEKSQLLDDLSLGQAVQNLLFPKMRFATINNNRFQFFHEAASTLSGDWFYCWASPQGWLNIIIGDVVGKGPGAAIAVATIFASLKRIEKDSLSMETCIATLNLVLFDLFDGYMNTTVMALSLGPDRHVDIWNCGGAGWFSLDGSSESLLPRQTGPIGMSKDVQWDKRSWQAKPNETILAFTDGFADGPRGCSRLSELGSDVFEQSVNFDEVYAALKNLSIEVPNGDDRTLVVLQVAA
jgi:hypothetical protein